MSQASGQIAVHVPAVSVTYIYFLILVWSSVSGASDFVESGKKNNAFKGKAEEHSSIRYLKGNLGQSNQPLSFNFVLLKEAKYTRLWVWNMKSQLEDKKKEISWNIIKNK